MRNATFTRKLSVCLLLLCFLFTPLEPLLAQESDVAPPAESGSEDSGSGEGGESISSVAANKWLNSYASRASVPEASHISGAFTYDIPIVTPPGRNGVEPSLRLSYNSQERDVENEFGTGWSINIPYIERINKSGVEDMYSQKFFNSSLDSELATSTSDNVNYIQKYNDGSFRKYTYNPASSQVWTMVDKNGVTYTFGTTTTGRLSDPSDSTKVYRWFLEEMRDTNGNSMKYEYVKDSTNNQIYPYRILYTNSATTSAPFEVSFATTTRSDTSLSYSAGFQIKTISIVTGINIKFNGSLVHKYVLTYSTGDNSVKSLLSTITETGYDESGTPSIKSPYVFSYQTNNISWSQSTPSPWKLPDLVDGSNKDLGYRVFNYQRDGQTQVMLLKQGTSSKGYDPSNWDLITVPGTPPALVDSTGADLGSSLGDINGDLFPDLLIGKLGGAASTHTWANGTFSTTTYANPPYFIESDGNDHGTRLGDFNGDGYADWILRKQGFSDLISLNVANGSGWDGGSTSNLPYLFTQADGNDFGARVVDLNGDGLDDTIRLRANENIAVYNINKGSGTSWDEYNISTSTANSPPAITGRDGEDIGTRFIDINSDGLVDIVVAHPVRGLKFYLNRGDGISWKEVSAATSGIPYFTDSSGADFHGTRLIQSNLDGIPDFVESGNSTQRNFTSSGNPVDVLNTIVTPDGGKVAVTYKGKAVDSVIFQTVDTVTTFASTAAGAATSTSDTYTFTAGEFKTTFQNRKFRGFGIVDKKDAQNNHVTTYYHQGNGANSSSPNEPFASNALGEYDDTEAKMYRPYRIETFTNSSSTFYTLQISKIEQKDLGDGKALVYAQAILNSEYNNDEPNKSSASSYEISTTTGDVLSEIQFGEVSGLTNGTFTDTGTDKRITSMSYASSTLLGTNVLSVSTTTDNGGSTISITRNYYDGLALGSVSKGNLTKQEIWKSGTSYQESQNTYNTYGLVATSTDARGKSTGYTYDPHFLYVATTTTPLGQKTSNLYNYVYGKVKQTTDPNNLVSQTVFDGLGRPTLVKQPDTVATSTLVTKTTFSYTEATSTNPSLVIQTDHLDGSNSVSTYSYFDGHNRLIQSRNVSEGGNVVVFDKAYNDTGQMAAESYPYFSTGTSLAAATTTTSLFTNFTYDGIGRITKTSNAVGSTTNSYDDWKVTITDPSGKQKKVYQDAFGNLSQVDEIDGASTYSTTYTWNGKNKLTKITDSDGNIRSFTYDGRGLLLTAQDLHNASDATFGTYTFVYNANGKLATSTDPRGLIVNFLYDDQGRWVSEDYTGTASLDLSYVYDSCAHGVGKLCQAITRAQSTNATTTYAYDAVGRVVQEDKKIGNPSYTTKYGYDRQGNLSLLTYPDNAEVQYTYNSGGLLEKLAHRESGGTFADIVTDFDYAPTGEATYTAFKNGMATTRTFDPAKLYRLTHLVTEFVGGMGGDSTGESFLLEEMSSTSDEESSTTSDIVGQILGASTSTAESEDDAVATTTEIVFETADQVATSSEEADMSGPSATTTDEAATSTDENNASESVATSTEQIMENIATSTFELLVEEGIVATSSVLELTVQKDDIRVLVKVDEDDQVPTAHFERWGETSLSISPTGSVMLAERSEDGKAIWELDDRKVRFYELPASPELPDGGFEIDAVFNEKPISNVVEFEIEAQNLDFFYQPALDKEQVEEGLNCTAMQCTDKDGNVVVERPEYVVGSYAVYYADGKSGDYSQIGGKNYRTGKAFHIFRPKISDAASSTTWGELNIDPTQGTLTVTVPQEFLDKATYPVVVDPTFGYGAAGASSASTQNAAGSKYTLTADGQVTHLTQYTKALATTTAIAAAMYSADGTGAPNLLLTFQNATTTVSSTSPAWATSTVTQYPVAASTTVWLWGWSEFSRTVYWDSGASNQYNIQGMTWPTWTNPIVVGTYFSRKLSIYATYGAVLKDRIQDLSYTYDAVGNITKIVDVSISATAKTVDYTYDNLHRMTIASTTNATSSPNYKYTYGYNRIGNLSSSTPSGFFQYTGTTTSNYANPHAPTVVGTTTIFYDRAGNIASSTAGLRITPNYRGMIANMNAATGVATSTYSYDENNNRIRFTQNSITRLYPNNYYDTQDTDANVVKHIYAGNQLVATIEKANAASASSSIQYIHSDHLGGTAIVTNPNAAVVETTDYYPFGAVKFDTKAGSFSEARKYIGEEYDTLNGLSYLNARYYDGARGQFLAQDPIFAQAPEQQDLTNPQALNSYSYAYNNPVTLSDPSGKCPICLFVLGVAAYTYFTSADVLGQGAVNPDPVAERQAQYTQLGLAGLSLVGPGGALKGGRSLNSLKELEAVNDLRIGDKIGKLGTIIETKGQEVGDISFYAQRRMAERGVSEDLVRQTASNPNLVLQQSSGNKLFLSPQAGVVLSESSRVITTYGSKDFNPIIQALQNILKTIENLKQSL